MTTLSAVPNDAAPFRTTFVGAATPFDDLDADAVTRLLRQPVRLAIVRALLTRESLSFSEIKRQMGLTDGNLSTHARKLEDAGIVSCTKNFKRRLPRTDYRLTPQGRLAVERFIESGCAA